MAEPGPLDHVKPEPGLSEDETLEFYRLRDLIETTPGASARTAADAMPLAIVARLTVKERLNPKQVTSQDRNTMVRLWEKLCAGVDGAGGRRGPKGKRNQFDMFDR